VAKVENIFGHDRRAGRLLGGRPQFHDYVAASHISFFVVELKPYAGTEADAESADEISRGLRRIAASRGPSRFPFNLPPIFGSGSTGG